MIIFVDPTQALEALHTSWTIDSSPVLMKPWNPTFDASCERLDSIPIWVRLPGLPPHLWSESCFKALRNFLGEYISADMSFLASGNMVVARILVSLNIREGLREFINLTDLGRTRVQIWTMKECLSDADDATSMDTW
jgi:hypothetical protein